MQHLKVGFWTRGCSLAEAAHSKLERMRAVGSQHIPDAHFLLTRCKPTCSQQHVQEVQMQCVQLWSA